MRRAGRQLDVVSLAGPLVVKMRVRVEVRAVAGRAALEVDDANQSALGERLEAVINGGKRDRGKLGLHAGKNFIGGGVVALFEEHAVNDLALRRRTQAAVGETLRKTVGGERGGGHDVLGVGQQIGMVLRRK